MNKRIAAFALAAAFAAGYAVHLAIPDKQPSIKPGTEFGIAAADVHMVSYQSSKIILTAQRSSARTAFAVLASRTDGGPVQQCIASMDLGGHLRAMTQFVVKRQVSPHELAKLFPVHLGVIDIRTNHVESRQSILVYANAARSAVAVIVDGYAAEVTTDPAVFTHLDGGCVRLGRSSPP